MKYYPVNLDIQNRPCLVVGGGRVGTRKVKTLLDCMARVTVVSLESTDDLNRLAETGRIQIQRRSYASSDLDGMFLVIGATDNEALNQRIHSDAEKRNMLCNIADRPAACNFILPAIVQRGDLILAISTSGKSPAFAKSLRKKLEREFGDEYEAFLNLMGAIRERLLKTSHEPEVHKPLFEKLIAGNLIGLIESGKIDRINQLLEQVLGEGFDYQTLLDDADKDRK